MSELSNKVEFSNFGTVISNDLIKMNPDIQWTSNQLCQLAVDESWNLDEMTEEGYFALKTLFFRMIVPKEHWDDVDYDKFLRIVLDKYHTILSEDL